MGVAVKHKQFGDTNFLQLPKKALSAGVSALRTEDASRPESRVPSQLARLLKSPEIHSAVRTVTPRVLVGTPATPRPPATAATTVRTRQKRQDEETLRTKLFWDQYAKEVQSEILKDTEKEKPISHLMYSANCGPELKFNRSDSCESLVTNLSLLSTSSLGKNRGLKEAKKRKKKKEAPPEIKTDWVRLAKERRGALDRLIAKDASHMEGIAHVSGANIIIQRAKVSELMSEEEKTLLHSCGFRQGLSGKVKSCSTANVISIISKSDHTKLRKQVSRSKKLKGSSGTPSIVSSSRAPSPKVIANQVRAQQRASSALAVLNDNQPMSRRHMSVCKGVKPDLNRDIMTPASTIHGLPDFQESNIFSHQVKRRIGRTLTDLEDMTGYGDPTDGQTVMSDDRRFTRADYAVIPRYPQHVRIAPQLCNIITHDIRKRMGRPRYHELRKADIERLNLSLPELGRSSRNLMIFNWLFSLDEDYDDVKVPGVYDVEGQRPKDRYPMIYDEIIGDDGASDNGDEDTEYETETNGASSVVDPWT